MTMRTMEDGATSQSKLRVHEKVRNLQGEEEPAHSPVWTILLIILVILLVVFGGVYCFQRDRNADLSYQERCNAVYKSKSENL